MQGKATIGWEKTSPGVGYNLIKDLPNGNRMVRHAERIVPNMFIIPSDRHGLRQFGPALLALWHRPGLADATRPPRTFCRDVARLTSTASRCT